MCLHFRHLVSRSPVGSKTVMAHPQQAKIVKGSNILSTRFTCMTQPAFLTNRGTILNAQTIKARLMKMEATCELLRRIARSQLVELMKKEHENVVHRFSEGRVPV